MNPANPATNKQVPDHSLMDLNGKQAYLGNQFSVTSGLVAIANATEVPVLYLACPAQPSQGAFQNQKSIFCNVRDMFSDDVTLATGIVYQIYLGATVAGGSALTPANRRPANPTVSIATATLSPTASNKGTLLYGLAVGFQSPALRSDLIILDPGQNLLITAKASAATTAFVNTSWMEF